MIFSVQVIDAAFGMPAADVEVQFRRGELAEWRELACARTGPDGRVELWHGPALRRGRYQIECDLDGFYSAVGSTSLYLRAILELRLAGGGEDLHLPLAISPHFLLAYRGCVTPEAEIRLPRAAGGATLVGPS